MNIDVTVRKGRSPGHGLSTLPQPDMGHRRRVILAVSADSQPERRTNRYRNTLQPVMTQPDCNVSVMTQRVPYVRRGQIETRA